MMNKQDQNLLDFLVQKYGPGDVMRTCTILARGRMTEAEVEDLLDFMKLNIREVEDNKV